MDMNWTDEIRDPEPLKRPIYNAADYDTRHGDPYYREHSTRAPGSISANDDSTAFFQDFLEGKKIVGLSM